jgi:hypothetical protein
MKEKYRQWLLMAVAVLSLLFLTNSRVQAQDNRKPKANLAIQLMLLSEEESPRLPNIVFVTSTTYNGNLGGLAGADQKCQARAEAAGLPKNIYKAWLSTPSVNAIDRLGGARGWVRVDGKPFADTKADISAGRIFYPPRVDELGNCDESLGQVWTATLSDGTSDPRLGSCSSWQVSTLNEVGETGWSDSTMTLFTDMGLISCSDTARLYCFGIDNNVQVTVAPMTGRIAFLTKSVWIPGGGVASADQKCTNEAQQAGLSGTFKALLATEGASAASRFDVGGQTWVRRDGVAIAATPTVLFSGDFLNSPINQSADGLEYFGNNGVWSGATDPATAGTSETTCNNWASSSGANTGVGGRAASTAQQRFFAFESGVNSNACNASWLHLYCLQE